MYNIYYTTYIKFVIMIVLLFVLIISKPASDTKNSHSRGYRLDI